MGTITRNISSDTTMDITAMPVHFEHMDPPPDPEYIAAVTINGNDLTGSGFDIQSGTIASVVFETENFKHSEFTGGKVESPNKYITSVTTLMGDVAVGYSEAEPLPFRIPYGENVTAIINTAPFEKSHVIGTGAVPTGKMLIGLTLDGIDMLSDSVADLPYGNTIELVPTFADIPVVSATFGTGLDSEKAYTSVHLEVTHSDGSKESVTGGYTFRNGDVVNIVGTEYQEPGPVYDNPTITVPAIGSTVKITSVNIDGQPNTTPGAVLKLPESAHVDIVTQVIAPPKIEVPTFVPPMESVDVKLTGASGEITRLTPGTYMLDGSGQTVSIDQTKYNPSPTYVNLPTIPAGDMVTDYTLAGASQGQAAALEPGETYDLETTTAEYAIEVNVNYTNTTVPNVNPGEGGG